MKTWQATTTFYIEAETLEEAEQEWEENGPEVTGAVTQMGSSELEEVPES